MGGRRGGSVRTCMAKRWIAAWPNIERRTAGWKSERRGRCGCIFSIGVAYENAMEAVISSQDVAIIWRSDERAPPRERAEKTYAEMIDSSIMICCCCSAESSVHRPWRMRSTM